MSISHRCVDCTIVPSGRLIFSGFFDNRLLSTSTPSMMKMDVAPVSAMAWSVAMVIAAVTSGSTTGQFFARFDAITVSSSCMVHIRFMVGSEDGRTAETKLLNLFAIPFSAPHRQVFVGSTFLCIPFVQGLCPAVMYCWAFARVNPSWWVVFRQSAGHVAEVCQSATSNPHVKHTFQFGNCFVVFENSGRRAGVAIWIPPGGAIGDANMGNPGVIGKPGAGMGGPPRPR